MEHQMINLVMEKHFRILFYLGIYLILFYFLLGIFLIKIFIFPISF